MLKKMITMFFIIASIIKGISNESISSYENVKYLVFSGGGVKGVAYAGALKAFEENGGDLNKIEAVAGASAGSILSVLVALGYNVEKITAIVGGLNYMKIVDKSGYLDQAITFLGLQDSKTFINASMAAHLENIQTFKVGKMKAIAFNGMYSGKALHHLIKLIVKYAPIFREAQSSDKSMMTLGDIAKYGTTDVFLTVTNLGNGSSVVLSSTDPRTQDIAIADAVRTSSGFPLFFFPVNYQIAGNKLVTQYNRGMSYIVGSNNIHEGKYPKYLDEIRPKSIAFADGGIVQNYPIRVIFDAFPESKRSDEVLGFVFESGKDTSPLRGPSLLFQKNEKSPDNALSFLRQLLNSLVESQHAILANDPDILNKTVFINTEKTSSMDFSLSESEVKFLYKSGYQSISGEQTMPPPLNLDWTSSNPFGENSGIYKEFLKYFT